MRAVHRSSPRPGPRKAKADRLIRQRLVRLWRSSDYLVKQMFESADVMSEGAAREESSGPTYYGTTSIVLLSESLGGHIPDADLASAGQLLLNDPHARVRAIRIAWREAQVRSTLPLGQVKAELSFSTLSNGVKIDVDVEAPQQVHTQRKHSVG